MEQVKSRFITRQEIISEVGRLNYERAIESKRLLPYKANGRNSKVRIDRNEYERYLITLIINNK